MKTVIVSLPYSFNVRNFVYTPVLRHMCSYPDIRFVLISPRREDGDAIRAQGCSNVIHELSRAHVHSPAYKGFVKERSGGRISRRLRYLWKQFDDNYLGDSLLYRFNYINNLAALRVRLAMTPAQQQVEIQSNRLKPKRVGMPFTGSKFLFRLLFSLRYGCPVLSADPWISHLFSHYHPDVLVLSRVQAPQATAFLPFLISARIHNVPVIGIVETWDHATTKGPIPPGCNVYVVGSRTTCANLEKYHGIPIEHTKVIGYPFFDNYRIPGLLDRAIFMQSIGLPADRKLIVFGSNATLALNAHEPSIARHIAKQVRQGLYGADHTLYIRTHPYDKKWREVFYPLHDPPYVVVSRASSMGYFSDDTVSNPYEDLRLLANLMKHANVVINTAGSLALDACAFDTPVIYLGFDGDLTLPRTDSIIVRYQLEHIKPVLDSQGVWLVHSYDELDRAINAYLQDSTLHSQGRRVIRDEHLEPLDGLASQRLVSLMVRFANRELTPAELEGHWDHKGIALG